MWAKGMVSSFSYPRSFNYGKNSAEDTDESSEVLDIMIDGGASKGDEGKMLAFFTETLLSTKNNYRARRHYSP